MIKFTFVYDLLNSFIFCTFLPEVKVRHVMRKPALVVRTGKIRTATEQQEENFDANTPLKSF